MPISKPVPAAESSEPFRLLDLPRELRDQIYRERLSLDKVEKGNQSSTLLRVNHQVYLEASAIMYDENVWVMVTFNFRGVASNLSFDYPHTYNITHDTTQQAELPFGREPAVRVDVQSQKKLGSRASGSLWDPPRNAYQPQESPQKYLITPLRYAETLFRSFTNVFEWQKIENFKFTVCLSERCEQRQTCQELVMDYLEDFRGIKEAAVSGMSPSASNDRLAQLMLAPIQQVDEISTRSCVYQRRGDRASDLGHFEEARQIIRWGLQNLLRSEKVLTVRSPDTNPANVKKQLLSKKMELVLVYGALWKRYGHGNEFDWVLENTADLTEDDKANAYYKIGLTCKEQASALKNQPDSHSRFEEDKLDGCAAYAFLQAYALHPGWAIVDHELDMLEDVVNQTPGYLNHLNEDWRPWGYNLRSILEFFRYKEEQLA